MCVFSLNSQCSLLILFINICFIIFESFIYEHFISIILTSYFSLLQLLYPLHRSWGQLCCYIQKTLSCSRHWLLQSPPLVALCPLRYRYSVTLQVHQLGMAAHSLLFSTFQQLVNLCSCYWLLLQKGKSFFDEGESCTLSVAIKIGIQHVIGVYTALRKRMQWFHQSQVVGQVYSSRHEFCPIEWGLNPIRQLLVPLTAVVLPLHIREHLAIMTSAVVYRLCIYLQVG